MSTRFRPRIEEIEDRITPSGTPADVFAAVQQIQMNTVILQFVTKKELVSNPITLPYVTNFLNYVHQTNTAAFNELSTFSTNIMHQYAGNPLLADFFAPTIVRVGNLMNEGQTGITYLHSFADSLSISLLNLDSSAGSTPITPSPPTPSPPSPPSPPAIDLTSDSGMTNTIPNFAGPDFIDLGDGVKVKDVLVGQGTAAASTSTVSVYYTGYLASNGTVFDSNRSPNSPVSFALAGTIDGFQEGVTGMRPGGIRQIFVPAAKGYGSAGQGSVPPNADLVFEVKVISVS